MPLHTALVLRRVVVYGVSETLGLGRTKTKTGRSSAKKTRPVAFRPHKEVTHDVTSSLNC